MNKKLLKLLATVTTTLVISSKSLKVVNAKELDLNTFSLTKVSEENNLLDSYDQIYLSLFENKNPSKVNLNEVKNGIDYLESGFHHEHMIKVNQIILSRLLQDSEKSPFIKSVRANEVTNELSYQSKSSIEKWITRVDLNGQGSTLTYASENYRNLWVMNYSTNENHTKNSGTYQFIISEIDNRHLNLSYTKGKKMLALFYHTFPNENQYICFFLEKEEQLQEILKSTVNAMNNRQTIDEFLSSDIFNEIDTSKQLSKMIRTTNKILEKKTQIK